MDSKKENKPENPWLNLGFNIILPSFLLIKGGKLFESLGITGENVDAQVFVFALAFPIAYGIWDLASRRKFNIFSVIGVLSVILTGGIGLMKMSREWIIVKEGLAACPRSGGIDYGFHAAPARKDDYAQRKCR